MQTQTEANPMSAELEALLAKMQLAEDSEPNQEDQLLGELDAIAGPVVEAAPVEIEDLVLPELTDEDLAAISLGETRAEVYQAQSDEAGVTLADPAAPVAAPAKKARAPKAAGTARPRTERDLNNLPDHVFQRHPLEPNDQAKADVLAKKPAQVKVAEKWENLFVALNAGAGLSKFTVTGFTLLKQNGTLTNTDLVAAMKADPNVGDGTARSQSGQIMALLPLVGVATRTGQTLTLRSDSVIADKLTAMLGL